MPADLLTVAEAAKLLNIGQQRLRFLAALPRGRRARIPSKKVNGRRLFERDVILSNWRRQAFHAV